MAPKILSEAKTKRLSYGDLLQALDDWQISYSAKDLDLELRARSARTIADANATTAQNASAPSMAAACLQPLQQDAEELHRPYNLRPYTLNPKPKAPS